MHNHSRFLIVGAGPTGLGAAWRLQELGIENWRLIESADSAGGLASSYIDDRGFTWDVGGHVIFSHYDYFDQVLDHVLGDAWVQHVREAWVWKGKQFIPYPFQNNIWRLPPEEIFPCLEGLLELHKQVGSNHEPETFHDWILQSFGRGLADSFFLPYNRKVWAYDPTLLATGWMGERVATVDLSKILRSIVFRSDDLGWGPNATFRFPLRGGTGAIWQALQNKLPSEPMEFGRSMTSLAADQREVKLSDGNTYSYDYLISTIPLDCLLRLLGDRSELKSNAEKFKYSSAHIVGIGLEGEVPAALRTKCWMYFPESDAPYYRATVFSNYSPHNVPKPGQQWSLMCEVSESPCKAVDQNLVVDEVVRGAINTQLLPDSQAVVSLWHKRLEYGYPTPFLGRDQLLDEIDPELRAANIWSRGRFGGWKYEVSNQDHSFMQGVEAINHILFGEEEMTYHCPNQVNSSKIAVKRAT